MGVSHEPNPNVMYIVTYCPKFAEFTYPSLRKKIITIVSQSRLIFKLEFTVPVQSPGTYVGTYRYEFSPHL